MGGSRVTIKDIAKQLHLSTATVSRTLSDKGEHNDKTVQLVKETARRMGYVRNTAAADLVQRQSHALAVVLSATKSNFSSSIVDAIERKALEHDLDVLIIHAGNENSGQQQRAIRTAIERAVRGIALISLELNTSTLRMLCESGIPCVVLSSQVQGNDLSFITSDNYKMGYQATEFLIQHGHRAIGLAGIPHKGAVSYREQGYRACMKKHGLPVDDRWVAYGSCVYEDGVRAADSFLSEGSGITAVMGVSDLTALGVMNRLTESGFRIPDDVSVMSFDGTDVVDTTRPRLTSVTQDFSRMGREGFDVLMGGGTAVQRYLPTHITERDSVSVCAR